MVKRTAGYRRIFIESSEALIAVYIIIIIGMKNKQLFLGSLGHAFYFFRMLNTNPIRSFYRYNAQTLIRIRHLNLYLFSIIRIYARFSQCFLPYMFFKNFFVFFLYFHIFEDIFGVKHPHSS